MKINIKELYEKVLVEIDEVRNSRTFDAIKYIDKRILIPACIGIAILFIGYYYFIFFVYSPGSNKTSEKLYDNTSKESQQIINKQATTSFYSSMKPNVYSNVTSPQVGADIYKIPANFMDITKVPVAETDNYVKVFDVIYDYLNEVNKGNYQTALLYLSKDFVAKNKITADILSNYHKNTYFPENTFIINSVVKADNIYNVRFFVGNKVVTGVGFYITYKLTETNGKLDISIDDLAKFIKR